MASLLVLVIDDLDKFPAVIEAWESIGVPGVTVLDSVGTKRLREHVQGDDVPLMPSLHSLFSREEDHNRTLFSVIGDHAVLERAIAEAERIVGNFMDPHTGIMFVLSVSQTWGVPKAKHGRKKSGYPTSSA